MSNLPALGLSRHREIVLTRILGPFEPFKISTLVFIIAAYLI